MARLKTYRTNSSIYVRNGAIRELLQRPGSGRPAFTAYVAGTTKAQALQALDQAGVGDLDIRDLVVDEHSNAARALNDAGLLEPPAVMVLGDVDHRVLLARPEGPLVIGELRSVGSERPTFVAYSAKYAPEGSVAAAWTQAAIRLDGVWETTDGRRLTDDDMDELISAGVYAIIRSGRGEEVR